MKQTFLSLFLISALFCGVSAFAQVGVGFGTIAPTALIHMKDGHIRSEQTAAPSISPSTVGTASNGIYGAIIANSTDTKGTITTTGINSSGDSVLTITLGSTHNVAPTVTLTPANSAARTCSYFVSSSGNTFTLTFSGGAANPSFNYIVIE